MTGAAGFIQDFAFGLNLGFLESSSFQAREGRLLCADAPGKLLLRESRLLPGLDHHFKDIELRIEVISRHVQLGFFCLASRGFALYTVSKRKMTAEGTRMRDGILAGEAGLD